MIHFEKFTLVNGLRVIVHHDDSTPIAAVNILYDAGAKDENPHRTGFAHLFEHLMFGGSINIPKYDVPLERAGGENNAFTNNDYTNYYITLPVANLETAFWLESDRMLDLAFSEQSLEVQRKVVVEEFKQRYLNQPYGDVWLNLRPLAYKVHPYQWTTIGKEISHIEEASMDEVKSFYQTLYNPANAILVVAGNVTTEQVKDLCDKWFEPIQKPHTYIRNIPKEPRQEERRELFLERQVPFDAMYMAFHMPSRLHSDYYACDLLSDVLSNGNSSRLIQRLIKEKELLSDVAAYISGDLDEGLFVVQAELMDGVTFKHAEEAIRHELDLMMNGDISQDEVEKVHTKAEAIFGFGRTSVLNKAMNLAYYELLGDAAMINEDLSKYLSVSREDMTRVAKEIFRPENASVLYYAAQNKTI